MATRSSPQVTIEFHGERAETHEGIAQQLLDTSTYGDTAYRAALGAVAQAEASLAISHRLAQLVEIVNNGRQPE